jgi:leucyl-tRNA synthetase
MENKQYILTMFPYPSGSGLHVGHYYNYAIMDSYARWQRYKGIEVFQPFGYDAFGLPAENYARKHNRDPREVTEESIANFRNQMKAMNTMYEEKLVTSDPSYYRWTQWLFTKLYEHGLAYKKKAPVNYCPSCETVVANSQVVEDKCERCSTQIEEQVLEQWFFKISEYKDRLIKNLEWLDYPESTKKQQRYWMDNEKSQDWCVSRQRKWGCPIPIEGEEDTLDTFVCSSFYFLRYLDPTNEDQLFDPSKYKQVDLYVGGKEHACMHLIYARFINMFLYDIGIVPEEEPFKRLIHQGMITYQGEKMSKTKGNVVNPDDYDQTELRMYLMFIGHYFDGGDWDDARIKGIRKHINRMKVWIGNATDDGEDIDMTETFEKVDGFMTNFKFNKVISSFMEFYNKNKKKTISKKTAEKIIEMYKCIAPDFQV